MTLDMCLHLVSLLLYIRETGNILLGETADILFCVEASEYKNNYICIDYKCLLIVLSLT